MKITHSSGESLDLFPDTRLEMQRTNPFFNEYGEQSLPVTLPLSARNKRLLDYPEDLACKAKKVSRQNVRIQAGIYHTPATQALLSCDKDGIQVSYYICEGSFYDKITDLELSTIFADQRINFATVAEAITFCRNLQHGEDERFLIFPVAIQGEATNWLNRVMDVEYTVNGVCPFVHETAQTVTIGSDSVEVPAGYFITPFIRANYLLTQVFTYLGYSLTLPLTLRMEPFTQMVFLNNTADAIITSAVIFSQIIPQISVKSLLDVYRKRFCGEFTVDEINKSVTFSFLKDYISSSSLRSLDDSLIGSLRIDYPETFRQIKISVTAETEATDAEDLLALTAKYTDMYTNPYTGEIYRKGVKGAKEVITSLGTLAGGYFSPGDLTPEEVTLEDSAVNMKFGYSNDDPVVRPFGSLTPAPMTVSVVPEISKYRSLNSYLSSESGKDSEDALEAMLCFGYHVNGQYLVGTVGNYLPSHGKIWEYTLFPNGEDGLYESFYRAYDNLLRNSLVSVSADINLSEVDKLSLSAVMPLLIGGQKLLPDVINYSPGKQEAKECTFKTTRLYTPVSSAISESERYNTQVNYKWVLHDSNDWDMNFGVDENGDAYYPTTASYDGIDYSTYPYTSYILWMSPAYVIEPETIFLPPPTEAQFIAGGTYFTRTYAIEIEVRGLMSHSGDSLHHVKYPATQTTWLTVEVVES